MPGLTDHVQEGGAWQQILRPERRDVISCDVCTLNACAYFHRFQLEMVAEQAGRTEKVKHINHEKGVEDGCGKFNVTKVSGA